MTTVGDVIEVLERAYPLELAESWDSIGLECGDRAARVDSVLIAVDPTEATVAEAIARGVQLLVTHHPLLLRGVHSVAFDTPKGRLLHKLIQSGIALYSAHTNADSATGGVNDALAATLGLTVTGPLIPKADGGQGLGRIGVLPAPETLAAFVSRVANRLPETAWGVRGLGDPDRLITRVAVMGGSGDSALENAVSAGVDVYVTADLRHHPALDHSVGGIARGIEVPALVDVAHWASEWPFCAATANVISAGIAGSLKTHVSTVCTDPWTISAFKTEVAQ
jgi:dinuclear metal center YbgI/SA1388 family protein